jgi:hypothetical protein
MPKTEQELRGLGGWLILLAIGLIAIPGGLLSHGQQMGQQFQQPGIEPFVTPGTAAYDPRWQMLFTIETTAHGIAVIPALLIIILFFFKHRFFPVGFLMLAAYLMLLTFVRFFLVVSTSTIAQTYQSPIVLQSLFSLLVPGVWMAYILRSRRVRLTFIHRIYARPYFPFFTIA